MGPRWGALGGGPFVLGFLGLVLVLPVPAWAVNLGIELTGLEGDMRKNALAHLQIYQEREQPQLRVGRLRRLHQRAPEQIRRALQPFGYYQVDVDADLASTQEGAWTASYHVRLGEQVRVSGVSYELTGEAAADPGFPQRFGVAEGDLLVHAAYEKAKDSLLYAAAERGYLDARFERSAVVVDPDGNTATVDVGFDSGDRYYFGPVSFDQEILRPEFLQRFVELESGEPYDQAAVLKLQTALLDTDYFQQVEIVPLTEERDRRTNQVPLEVIATENKKDKFRIGAGFGTDIGPRVTFDWMRRYVNRNGHRAKAELMLAQKKQELSGEYRIPLDRPASEHIVIKPEIYRLETDSRIEEVVALDAAHSVMRRGWRRNIGVQISYEDYDIADEQQDLNEIVPYIELSRTVSDNPLYTSEGYRLKFALLGTLEYVSSTSNYLSTTASGKWVTSLADDYRFITRADLGATWADSIQDVPGSRRFFAGGDQSIRGYGYEALGPRDPDSGEVLGGRYLAVGSVELERKIEGDWSAALFYDFGNAFDPDLDNEFKHSVGGGVRWRSPIGQVRLDVGVGIESDDTPIRAHLIIGPDL